MKAWMPTFAILMLALAGCATAPPADTASPAAAIKAQAQQVARVAGDLTQHANAIDAVTPLSFQPSIVPHTTAIRADADTLSGTVAPKLTAAGKDAGQVAKERDRWRKKYQAEVKREKSALQTELRKVSIGAGLVGLVLIGLGIWLGISGNIKWAASVGSGGVAALIIAGIAWKIAPWIGWILWLAVFAMIVLAVLFVIHKVGVDKLESAWTRLVAAIEQVGESGNAVMAAVENGMKGESAKVAKDFGKLVSKARAK